MDYREPQESQTFFETRTLQTQCRWKVIAYDAKLKGFSTVFARYAVRVQICRPSRRYGQNGVLQPYDLPVNRGVTLRITRDAKADVDVVDVGACVAKVS